MTASSDGSAGAAKALDPGADDDLYRLLGVPYTASTAEITRAYRAAMKRAHPDRHARDPQRRAAAEEQAKRLNHAFTTLTKPTLRRAYDQSIRARAVQEQLMGRYVGGFGGPTAGSGATDPFGTDLRRARTSHERREQARADRSAVVSVVLVFGGVTLAVILAVVVVALVGELLGTLF